MNLKNVRVLVIIPAYNEEKNLVSILEEIRANAPFADILVVDDSSVDRTSSVARENKVKTLRLPFNLGIGGAVQTGFKYAIRNNYDVAVQVDADGQHDTSFLYDLVDLLLMNKADIIIGSRYIEGNPVSVSFVRDIGIRYFSWLTSKVIGQKITDCTSGYRAINRKALEYFSNNYPVDFPDAEALILAHRNGLRIAETQVKFRKRMNGKSSLHTFRFLYYPLKETLSVLKILTKGKVETNE